MKRKKLVRWKFRDAVFSRDQYTCQGCVECLNKGPVDESELDAHHITDRNEMPNGGYVKENGITLCAECHMKAEQFHVTGGKNWEEGFHPDQLYAKINSCRAKAIEASRKLK